MASVGGRKTLLQGSAAGMGCVAMMAPSLAAAHEMSGVPHHLHMEAIGAGVADLMSHLVSSPLALGGVALLSLAAVATVRWMLQRKRQGGVLKKTGGRFTA